MGTGTLTTANGTTILAGAVAQTIGNTLVVNGNLNFGGPLAANNLTLSGSVSLGGDEPRVDGSLARWSRPPSAARFPAAMA